jgi:excisionase family DNA binding protein
MDERLWTVAEVASHLRVTPQTVQRWILTGRLAAYKLAHGRIGWRVPQSEVERLLNAAYSPLTNPE